MFDILIYSFIIKVLKLFIDIKATTTVMQKDKRILSKITIKT